jgi:hypothetical protein
MASRFPEARAMGDDTMDRGEPNRSPREAREQLERWIKSACGSGAMRGDGNSLGERARWTLPRSKEGSATRHQTK